MTIWDMFPENYSLNQAQADAGEIGIAVDNLLDQLIDNKGNAGALHKIKKSLEEELRKLKEGTADKKYNSKTLQLYRAFANAMYHSLGINNG